MKNLFHDQFLGHNKSCRKKISHLEFNRLFFVVIEYYSNNSLKIKCDLTERNSKSWFFLLQEHSMLLGQKYFIATYRHLGFGNATTPSIILVKLYNNFFPDDAKPIESRKKRQSNKPNAADQANLSLQIAISDFNVATDQFLKQNICPQKTDAGNAPIATKNT